MTDGKPGMENQCLGLAEALGVTPEVKRVAPRPPWRWLPPHLWFSPLSAVDDVAPPWPELLIATGRQTVALALAIKARNRATFAVQIQDPVAGRARFDLIAVPEHDNLTGANVIATLGALHRVTPQVLAAAAPRFEPMLQALPRPLVAVLLGGANKQYRLSEARARTLAEGLARLPGGLAITPSRRTGEDAMRIIRAALGAKPAVIWDGTGENPYFGFLAHADAIVVTGDSVSMVSEACATGKPVYVFDLEGGSRKFERFHRTLRDRGITRPFDGTLAAWRYPPLDDTARVADEVRRRFALAANFGN
ncbi:MAG TPA: mitochondrial fission ELM1 family protein [Alphaproteobacteria bacterium]